MYCIQLSFFIYADKCLFAWQLMFKIVPCDYVALGKYRPLHNLSDPKISCFGLIGLIWSYNKTKHKETVCKYVG